MTNKVASVVKLLERKSISEFFKFDDVRIN